MPYTHHIQTSKAYERHTCNGAQRGGLQIGDHICAFYKTSDDYIHATKNFIQDGIAHNQKIIFYSPIPYQEQVFEKVENDGIRVEELFQRKQMEIHDAKDTYFKGGTFNPNHVAGFSIEKAKESLQKGFTATRVAGTGCQIAGCVEHEAWVNYERSVTMDALKDLNFIAVCNYFIDGLPGSLLNQIIEAHPLCQLGHDLLVNPNYLPLNINQSQDRAKAEFEFRLNKMYEHKQREDIIFGLYKKTQKLSEFSHMLSHELKAPIRTASVLGEMISSKAAGSGEELYEELLKNLKIAYKRLESVEMLSSVATAAQKKNTVNLKEAIVSIAYEAEEHISINHGKLILEKLEDHYILADQTHIHQILHNLIENAIKYRRQDVPLEISISMEVSPFEDTIIHIKDNGQGIDPRFHEKIFMPFVRLTNSDIQTGKGMGLPICSRIMEMYGGRINVDSKLGYGSTFSLIFPKMVLN